jgi:outer membrane beta-barrel protein
MTPRAFAMLALALAAPGAFAQGELPRTDPQQVIEPQVDRREVVVPRIDTEDFEVGAYFGIFSVEDFGANSVVGGRLAYHVTENVFLEAAVAQTTVTDEVFANLGVPQFPKREEDLTYYALSAGFAFFPGEVFLGKNRAMTSAAYIQAGVGNTSFIDESRFTINFGIGIRVLPVDWLALHVMMRDFLFESDILGTNKLTNNFELTAGLAVYF